MVSKRELARQHVHCKHCSCFASTSPPIGCATSRRCWLILVLVLPVEVLSAMIKGRTHFARSHRVFFFVHDGETSSSGMDLAIR